VSHPLQIPALLRAQVGSPGPKSRESSPRPTDQTLADAGAATNDIPVGLVREVAGAAAWVAIGGLD